MPQLMMGALFIACCTVGVTYAADIYQWKDVSGITHFTDNEMNVPEKFRKKAKRKVNKLQFSKVAGQQGRPQHLGKAAWLAKCALCHTTGEGSGDKLGLGFLSVNKQSKFPATVEEIVPKLRRATEGRLSGMPKLDVSTEQLKQLAAFILGVK